MEENKQENNSPKKAKAVLKELSEYIILFVVALLIMLFLNHFIIINARIPSASMEDTVMTGDRLIGSRLAYKHEIPQRFDMIIFKFPDDESQLFIKRVIGLPGETVNIIDGKVYINDSEEPLDDSFTKEIPNAVNFGPYYVPANSYFVMGDNRNMSTDSRSSYVGLVNRSDIIGEAWMCIWPLNHFGTLTR